MDAKPEQPRRTRLNLAIAWTWVTLMVITLIATAAQSASWFERTYPNRAVAVIERIMARSPHTKVFADVHYSDWLIWHDPALAGHVAYDTSLELLTGAQLTSLASLGETPGPGVPNTLGPYSVLVLNPINKSTNRTLLARRGVHVIMRNKHVIIATKPVT